METEFTVNITIRPFANDWAMLWAISIFCAHNPKKSTVGGATDCAVGEMGGEISPE
jgi:hypothetical protein